MVRYRPLPFVVPQWHQPICSWQYRFKAKVRDPLRNRLLTSSKDTVAKASTLGNQHLGLRSRCPLFSEQWPDAMHRSIIFVKKCNYLIMRMQQHAGRFCSSYKTFLQRAGSLCCPYKTFLQYAGSLCSSYKTFLQRAAGFCGLQGGLPHSIVLHFRK